MHIPPQFREDDPERLRAAITACGLGILVTHGADGLTANHVPMMLEHGGNGLIGHLARNNRQATASGEALAIFPGPEAYVSPSWYPSKQAGGKVVPTWNFTAVHATGPITFFSEPDRLLRIVTRLTERHEAGRTAPWAVSDAPEDFIASMLRGIIGFRIAITRLEGKWKMSQNRNAADRAGVIAGLRAAGRDDVADLIPRG